MPQGSLCLPQVASQTSRDGPPRGLRVLSLLDRSYGTAGSPAAPQHGRSFHLDESRLQVVPKPAILPRPAEVTREAKQGYGFPLSGDLMSLTVELPAVRTAA